ncbi:MAG: dihydrodipicolinate reductase C-terminal domain-containing protein [Clostridia bacterium]
MEIIERHHNQKIDAPSGTALSMAEALKDELGDEYFFELDRSAKRQKRDPKEIGI